MNKYRIVGGLFDGMFVETPDGLSSIAFATGLSQSEDDGTISMKTLMYDRVTLDLPAPTVVGVSCAFETVYSLRVAGDAGDV
jgi:hypothetical protein